MARQRCWGAVPKPSAAHQEQRDGCPHEAHARMAPMRRVSELLRPWLLRIEILQLYYGIFLV